MNVTVREVGQDWLSRYGEIPISFTVESVLRVHLVDEGLGGIVLREERVESPYLKDYDAFEDEGPTRWAEKFDISRWAIFMAFENDQPVGGATVLDSPSCASAETVPLGSLSFNPSSTATTR